MKVKDLIAELEKFDPELDVVCYSEDEALLPPGHLFRLFDIEDVAASEGEWRKGDDGVPSMKFVSSESARKHVFIHVTSDF